jgi:hypothetical protein
VKALTLTQPWASLVMAGVKRIETRGWQTRYRGPLVIHAARGWTAETHALARDLMDRDILPARPGVVERYGGHNPDLPLGAALGIAQLVDVCPTFVLGKPVTARAPGGGRAAWYVTELERELGDYSEGRYAWLLADPEPFPEPVPCKGALGLWNYAP